MKYNLAGTDYSNPSLSYNNITFPYVSKYITDLFEYCRQFQQILISQRPKPLIILFYKIYMNESYPPSQTVVIYICNIFIIKIFINYFINYHLLNQVFCVAFSTEF